MDEKSPTFFYIHTKMKTIKLSNAEAELVVKAISAYIREEEREQYQCHINGYQSTANDRCIAQLRELKRNINNQIN